MKKLLLGAAIAVLFPLMPAAQAQDLPTPEQISFVKACRDSAPRKAEAYGDARKSARELRQMQGEADVPLSLKLVLSRIVQASPVLSALERVHGPFTLLGYQHGQPNAQLAGANAVLVSDAVWSEDNPLPLELQAALLAHELAHLEENDPVLFGCYALSRTGGSGHMHEAVDRELTSGGKVTQQLLHEMEQAADKRARRLLAAANFDPGALEKLLNWPGVTVDTATLTHPAKSDRLAALRKP